MRKYEFVGHLVQLILTLYFLNELAEIYLGLFDRKSYPNIFYMYWGILMNGITLTWVGVCTFDLINFLFESDVPFIRRVLQPVKVFCGFYVFRAVYINVGRLKTLPNYYSSFFS